MRTLGFLVIGLLTSSAVFSQDIEGDKNSIDIALENCLDIDSNQTTVGMMECAYTAEEAWDKELNKYYRLLMQNLAEEDKALLKTAQKNWLTYRDSERDFEGSAYYNLQGTMYRVFAADRYMEITKERAEDLRVYYEMMFDYENSVIDKK
jgi:uncharacterized protein YecT (DUF1311 family)